jgi:hypothetical protein
LQNTTAGLTAALSLQLTECALIIRIRDFAGHMDAVRNEQCDRRLYMSRFMVAVRYFYYVIYRWFIILWPTDTRRSVGRLIATCRTRGRHDLHRRTALYKIHLSPSPHRSSFCRAPSCFPTSSLLYRAIKPLILASSCLISSTRTYEVSEVARI